MHEDSRPPDVPATPAGAGQADGDAGEVQALRERISALCAASGRISACGFRTKSITDSGANRSVNPIQSDH